MTNTFLESKYPARSGFVVLVTKSCLTLCNSMDVPDPWDFPVKNTGVGCHLFHDNFSLSVFLESFLLTALSDILLSLHVSSKFSLHVGQ